VKFHVSRRGRVKGGSELVDFSSEPLDLSFINADAAKHEIFFSGVARRPSIVQIKKVHKRKMQPSGV
jgi:hypothetical protein